MKKEKERSVLDVVLLEKPELNAAETKQLLGFALDNVGSANYASQNSNRRPFDIFGTGQRGEQFGKVIEMLGDIDSKITLDEETQDKVALLVLGVFHAENAYNIIENGYASAENLSRIVDEQLAVPHTEGSKTVAFLEDMSVKLTEDSPEIMEAEDLAPTAGPCVDEILETATSENMAAVSAVVFTEKFAENNHETCLRFFYKTQTLVDNAIGEKRFDDLDELVEMIQPSNIGTISEAFGEDGAHELDPVFTKIGESLLSLIDLNQAFIYPELTTKILEWEYVTRRYFSPDLTMESLQKTTGILTQLLTTDKIKRLNSEPTTSFSLINSCLGFVLGNLAPGNSPFVNEFAGDKVADYAEVNVRKDWVNLVNFAPVVDLAMVALMRLRESYSESAPSSLYINGKEKISDIIRQSPDLINLLKIPRVSQFATMFLESDRLLQKVQKATGNWLKLISDGLADTSEAKSRQGAQFLLNRLHLAFFTNEEELGSEQALVLEKFIRKVETDPTGNFETEWKNEVLPLARLAVAEAFLVPNAQRITDQLRIAAEKQPSFVKDLVNLLKSTTPENQAELSVWLLPVTDEYKRNPGYFKYFPALFSHQRCLLGRKMIYC